MADDVVALHPEAQSFVESVKNGTVPRHYQGRPLDALNGHAEYTPISIKASTASDPVKRPAHYRQLGDGLEAIDLIEMVVKDYEDPVLAGLVWQVLKYVIRAPHKGKTAEDLGKADWYMRRLANKAVTAKPKVNRG